MFVIFLASEWLTKGINIKRGQNLLWPDSLKKYSDPNFQMSSATLFK
ncbi:hypothetical protein ALTBGP9_00431 [Alteromonas macleodii]|nr:hypothetical protein ALT831_00431 [Alteromonas macleodii]CAI3930045.1 hypothetical protein ALTBGP6_00431 [Alteromonas macleodii]CAI3930184.1 hypothetical protein ALTBGP14_00431 [Alteromonas macleodii]CAI3930193.1 hypothetical protein ALTBGP9_00431 [Alteromonas macleodii]VTO38114.1 hypothetical protein ALTBGP6_00431 [Alteromonas macleodii]